MSKETKKRFGLKHIWMMVEESAILFFSFHYARIWDIVHNKVIVNDPLELKAIYMDNGSGPLAVAISTIYEASGRYGFYFEGVQLGTALTVFLILSAMYMWSKQMLFRENKEYYFGTAKWNQPYLT